MPNKKAWELGHLLGNQSASYPAMHFGFWAGHKKSLLDFVLSSALGFFVFLQMSSKQYEDILGPVGL